MKKKKPVPPGHVHSAVFEVCSCGAVKIPGGEWTTDGEGKNPAARAMAARRRVTLTPEERSAAGVKAAAKRWEGTTKEERVAYMKRIAGQPRPNSRTALRCPCGRFTQARANARRHVCFKARMA